MIVASYERRAFIAFIKRLAALIPRPHKNLVFYSGVLAPNAKLRSQVVAYGREQPSSPATTPVGARFIGPETREQPTQSSPQPAPKRPNYTWADLMPRTFAIDVPQCPNGGGRLKLLAAVLNSPAIRGILASLGLSADAPEMHPARAPPETWECA